MPWATGIYSVVATAVSHCLLMQISTHTVVSLLAADTYRMATALMVPVSSTLEVSRLQQVFASISRTCMVCCITFKLIAPAAGQGMRHLACWPSGIHRLHGSTSTNHLGSFCNLELLHVLLGLKVALQGDTNCVCFETFSAVVQSRTMPRYFRPTAPSVT